MTQPAKAEIREFHPPNADTDELDQKVSQRFFLRRRVHKKHDLVAALESQQIAGFLPTSNGQRSELSRVDMPQRNPFALEFQLLAPLA